MDPWKSWAIVGVVGAGAAYYYSRSGKRGPDRTSSLKAELSQRRGSDSRNDNKDTRKKKAKAKASDASDKAASDAAEASSTSTPAAAAEKTKKRKGNKQQPSKLAQSSAPDVSNKPEVDLDDNDEENEEINNEDFAKQMSGLKTGSSLKKPNTNGTENKKTRKQGKSKELQPNGTNATPVKPNGLLNTQDLSTASSTTGADADDDLSLPVSPDLGATDATTPSGGDVSDMLEAPAKGPSVLRITQPTSSQPARQLKQNKVVPEPETKKQRQRRQKNEDKKILHEQVEKERRALLEKQLRTAREAEGRPAKNGLGTSKAPSTNAWDKSKGSPAAAASGALTEPSNTDTGALLDTFEGDKSFLGQPAPQVNGGAKSLSTEDGKTWNNDLPSEEEQMRLITEMDSDNTWNTVAKGGKNKKKSAKITPVDKSFPSGSSKKTLGHGVGNDSKTETNSNFVDIHDSSSANKEAPATSTGALSSEAKQNNAPSANADISNMAASEDDKRVEADHCADDVDEWNDPNDYNYPDGVPLSVSNRWRAIAKNLDRHVWSYDNIKEHPDYNADWPYALTGHPMDSDWAGDWDFDDMRKGNEKRAEEEASKKAAQKAERKGQHEEE